MATIDLTSARLRELLHFNPETGVFTWRRQQGRAKANDVAGVEVNGYVQIRVDGRLHYAHRLAWLFLNGRWPEGVIDHLNGIRNDNRAANLRAATYLVNVQNSAPSTRGKSGLAGAYPEKKRFRAKIMSNRAMFDLGLFDTPEEANAAYLQAKRKLHTGWVER